jgi:predicted porin
MKYILGAVALALVSPAFAQSSVTVYGVVDAAGEYISGHGKEVRVTSGGLNGSRIGFKGTEDLGSGNFVDFVLEGGLNLDTGSSGQGGALFGRQAFGALRTANAGTFSAGRQYGSTYNITDQYSVFSNTPIGATTALLGGYAGGYEPVQGSSTATTAAVGSANGSELNGSPARVNNSFRYTTPSFAGFTVSGLYGAGEQTGHTSKTRLFDGSVRYVGYGLDATVAFVSDKADGVAATSSTVATTTTNVNTFLIGAKYTIDAFRIDAGFLKGDDKRAIAVKQSGTGYWLGGDYTLGANIFKAQWVHNKLDNTTTSYAVASGKSVKNNSYGVGYQYNLSKRTAVYTDLTRFQNTGVARFDSSIPSGVTSGTDLNFTQFALGVRHSF